MLNSLKNWVKVKNRARLNARKNKTRLRNAGVEEIRVEESILRLVDLRNIESVKKEEVEAIGLASAKHALTSVRLKQLIESGLQGKFGVIVSLSHDNYTVVDGGVQLCVGVEEASATDAGFLYLHLHPFGMLKTMAPADVSQIEYLGLTVAGDFVGVVSYSGLKNCLASVCTDPVQVHLVIHQLKGHSIECIEDCVAALKPSRVIYWVHDYFGICTSPHLLRNNATYCDAPNIDSNSCTICAYRDSRAVHVSRLQRFFENVRPEVVAPSEVSADVWKKKAIYPNSGLTVHPHVGIDWSGSAIRSTSDGHRPITVSYLGIPVHHKGWAFFERLYKKFGSDSRYRFIHFGSVESGLGVKRINVKVNKQNRMAMIDALKMEGVDLVIHYSPTPETFSFTTHEAMAAGAFVLTNATSGNTSRTVQMTSRGVIFGAYDEMERQFASGEILACVQKLRRAKCEEEAHVEFSRMSIDMISEGQLT